MRSYHALNRVRTQDGGPLAGPGSYALLATGPAPRAAIVFVHGLGGSPVGTWGDFPSLIIDSPRFQAFDLYFYSYRSVSSQIGILASECDYLIRNLWLLRQALLAGSEKLSTSGGESGTYEKLVVVAHSLGGVLARQAALDATAAGQSWPSRAQLVLFAPAHCGARLATSLMRLFESVPFLQLATPIAGYLIPASDELHPEHSTVLRALRERTEAHASADPSAKVWRSHCVFGDREHVVIVAHFLADARRLPNPYRIDHGQICRPTAAWRWPLDFLEEAIQEPSPQTGQRVQS